jgi:hypothetical protein
MIPTPIHGVPLHAGELENGRPILESFASRIRKHLYYIIRVTDTDSMTRFRAAVRDEIDRPNDEREALWEVLAEWANEMRANGVTAERFVIHVKSEWDATLLDRGGVADSPVQRLKQDVVTRAIKAYYMQ